MCALSRMLLLARTSVRSVYISKYTRCMFRQAGLGLTSRIGGIARPLAISSPPCSSYVTASCLHKISEGGVYRKRLAYISARPTSSLRLPAIAAAGASTAKQSPQTPAPSSTVSPVMVAKEYSSFANATAVKVAHNHFDLEVDFDRKIITGSAQVHHTDSTFLTLNAANISRKFSSPKEESQVMFVGGEALDDRLDRHACGCLSYACMHMYTLRP